VTRADTPVIPDEMETPQTHEAEVAKEEPPVQVNRPTLETPSVVVDSPVAAAPPVQLERSQRTRAPSSYLKDFLCDAVDKPPTLIIKEIWETSN